MGPICTEGSIIYSNFAEGRGVGRCPLFMINIKTIGGQCNEGWLGLRVYIHIDIYYSL